jgi:hypothetical protein
MLQLIGPISTFLPQPLRNNAYAQEKALSAYTAASNRSVSEFIVSEQQPVVQV